MKQFFRPLLLICCAAVALFPAIGSAQQPRTRPAARPTASPSPNPSPGRHGRPAVSPTPQPTPTPTIIPAAPLDEMNEQSPPSDSADDAPVSETVIDASDGATFASKDRIAVFSGNVRVTDPRFQLSCDKLTVFLNKSAPAATGANAATPAPANATPPLASPGNTPPPPAANGDQGGGGGGIDHCVAEGHVIILQKRAPTKPGEEEKISIGRGDKGTFDNKSGDMVLYGMPEIEQNGNKHAATSPDTVMTIHKDSSLDTKGPNKTTLIQKKGSGSAGIEMPGVPTAPAGGNNKPKKVKPGSSPQPSQG